MRQRNTAETEIESEHDSLGIINSLIFSLAGIIVIIILAGFIIVLARKKKAL